MNKNRTRIHDVHLRLDDDEYKILEERRSKCNLSQQTYLRKLVRDEKPRESPSADFFAFNRELVHIQVELSSLALRAKEYGALNPNEYWTVCKKIENLIHKVFSAIMFPEWVMEEVMKEKKNKTD